MKDNSNRVYNEQRPYVTFRTTPEIKERLMDMKKNSNKTLSDATEDAVVNGLNHTGVPHSENAVNDDYSLDDLVREVGEIRKRGHAEGYVDCLNDKKDNPNALSFIGGTDTPEKKDDKENDDDEEEDLECGGCGAELDEECDFCPECGEELDWENETDDDDEEEGWLASLINWNNGG